MPLTTVQSGMMDSVAQYYSFKNRLINGAMIVDQRNNGASVTQTTTGLYPVDRWIINGAITSKFTAQQNAGSVTPPAGFIKYLGITSSSAYTLLASDYYLLQQSIEGFNTADFGWGTANAATVTLSFWVRSSLTGTFGGSIRNYVATRSYPFSFTISSANTWEQKSITITGDTSGTWATDNSGSLVLAFSMGTGSTFSGTAGSWVAGNYVSVTGATSVVGTNGATFYITGVQIEKGVTATSFDYRPYTTELQLCQRYFAKTFPQEVVPAQNVGSTSGCLISNSTSASAQANTSTWVYPVIMRTAPSTVTTYNPFAANSGFSSSGAGNFTAATYAVSDRSLTLREQSGGVGVGAILLIHAIASAEL